ncbi:MAG: class I SAM-dependent methyltransferase [Bacteroidales bacterium]|nr:class I SAM-dependent methyltransferase [Bacteroidales bacterium]
MHYDPIKRTLGSFFNRTPRLRILFYNLLDILLLRSWHIRKALRQWSQERGGKSADALDAGSGFGQYSYRLAKLCNGGHVTGVDVKDEQIADCNAFFKRLGMADRAFFEVADLTTYRRPNSFDLILSVDVMEHIEADEAVFANFSESLRPGGLLLISTPSDQGGSDADEHDHDGQVHGFIDEHVRDGYNIDDIAQKLRRAGFSRVEAAFSYGAPGHVSWVLSMKWPISLLNVSKAFFILLPFYYVVTFPFCLILNWADVANSHKSGTGLIVKAFK